MVTVDKHTLAIAHYRAFIRWRAGSCPAGVFPLGLGGKTEFEASIFLNFGAKFKHINNGDLIDRQITGIFHQFLGITMGGIDSHDGFPLVLGDLEFGHVETLGDFYGVQNLVFVAKGIVVGRAHLKSSGGDKAESHFHPWSNFTLQFDRLTFYFREVGLKGGGHGGLGFGGGSLLAVQFHPGEYAALGLEPFHLFGLTEVKIATAPPFGLSLHAGFEFAISGHERVCQIQGVAGNAHGTS